MYIAVLCLVLWWTQSRIWDVKLQAIRKGNTISLLNGRAKVEENELAPLIIVWGHFLAIKHLFQKVR